MVFGFLQQNNDFEFPVILFLIITRLVSSVDPERCTTAAA